MATNPIVHEEDIPTEDTPLLEPPAQPSHSTKLAHASHLQLYVVSLVLALITFIDLGAILALAPRLRLIENIFCANFYREHDPTKIGDDGVVPEALCKKIDIVQGQLALLYGWMVFFDTVPSLFLAIPYGYLADRYGRKWLMVLNAVSLALRFGWIYIVCAFPDTLPIQLTWLEGVFCILGGGTQVVVALLFTIVSDVTPEDQRATTFFLLGAGIALASAIAPPVASILMDRNPWIPMTLSVGLVAIAIPFSLALPETLGARPSHHDVSTIPNGESTSPHQTDSPNIASFPDPLAKRSVLEGAIVTTGRALSSASFLLRDWRLIFIILIFIVNVFNGVTGSLLLQYASKRFEWTLSKANYIYSLRALLAFIVLVTLLPSISYWLTQRRMFTTLRKDILLMRLSYSIITMGQLVIGVAESVPLLLAGVFLSTIGEGGSSCARSVLTTLVQPDEVARVFTAVSVVATVGSLIAEPMVAGLFSAGLRLGGGWVGLPYFVCGGLFAGAAMGMWMLDLSGKHGDESPGDEVGNLVDGV